MANANMIKGSQYEVQIRDFIARTVAGARAFLWPDAPEEDLIRMGVIGSHNESRLRRKQCLSAAFREEEMDDGEKHHGLADTGIDIVQVRDELKFKSTSELKFKVNL